MKNRGKRYAFLAALLSLSILLTGCTSGSNTGVWIAIIVMVFVAVFAATSGVVYLVLQRILPPEEEQRHTVHPVQHRNEEIDDVTSRPPLRASTQKTQASAQSRAAEWICPRDHTRNTGPYCTACGDSRPQRQAVSQATRQAAAQTVRRTESAPQSRQSYTSAAPQTRTQSAASAGTAQTRAQTYASAGSTQPRTQTAASAGSTQSRTQTTASTSAAQVRPQAAAPQQERAYTGKFARKEPQATPSQETSTAEEPEYDAELLAAIFREAEQGDGEQ